MRRDQIIMQPFCFQGTIVDRCWCAAVNQFMEKSERRRLAAAAAEKRLRGDAPGATDRQEQHGSEASDPCDPRASELLKVFDKVHAQAVVRHKNTGMDAHHAPALRKAKKSVEESLARGDNLTLSSLHTLKNVGHWVVSQLRESLEGPTMPAAKRTKQQAAATPESFSWWYVNAAGKRVEHRNDAEMKDGAAGNTFRVTIMHSSGRVEKAWLPDAKAPASSPAWGIGMIGVVIAESFIGWKTESGAKRLAWGEKKWSQCYNVETLAKHLHVPR